MNLHVVRRRLKRLQNVQKPEQLVLSEARKRGDHFFSRLHSVLWNVEHIMQLADMKT